MVYAVHNTCLLTYFLLIRLIYLSSVLSSLSYASLLKIIFSFFYQLHFAAWFLHELLLARANFPSLILYFYLFIYSCIYDSKKNYYHLRYWRAKPRRLLVKNGLIYLVNARMLTWYFVFFVSSYFVSNSGKIRTYKLYLFHVGWQCMCVFECKRICKFQACLVENKGNIPWNSFSS